MVDLDRLMPVDDNETYTRHVYLIVILWIVVTLLIAVGFTLFIP